MQFFDIFNKNNKTKLSEKAIPKITADIHEKNSQVIANLANHSEVNIKHLEVGDYIAGDFIIERKTFHDFISSMLSKRLQKQLKNLEQVEKKMIIIEGYLDINKEGKLNPNSIRGQIISILNYHKIPIIFTKDAEETAEYLILLGKQQLKPISEISLHARKPASIQEQKEYILESFPSIGPKTAKELLKKFNSIKNIINASEEELKSIIGLKAKILKELIGDSLR